MINKPTSSSTTTQKNAVSTIMYHCGVALQMDYDPDGSGAYSLLTPSYIAQGDRDIPYALKKHFRYSSAFGRFKSDYSDAIWKALIKEELDKGRPILYSGEDASAGGHGFICDGYDNNDKFHFNFGWNGSYDGYYALTAITPDSYNFSSSQNAIFAFVPDSLNTELNPADMRLYSTKMTISSTTVMSNGSLSIEGRFANYGYDTLKNGQIGLAIYDHAGNLVTRQAGNFSIMNPYSILKPTFTVQLNGIAQGAYYAKLCYKLNGDTNWYFIGDDANQTEMLRNRVDFDVLSDKYITLNVKKDSSISINLSANTPTATSILVRSGDSTYTITADTAMTGIKTFKAGANTMTIYGDVNRFDCKENYTKITGIDASKNTGLTFLYCSYNDLTSLDLSKNVALCTLYCSYTKIKSLNVNGCTALTYIQCMHDSLSTLDLSTNTALTKLFCTYNKLTSLNVRNNTALCTLSCNDNKLTSLDVSNNVALCSLSCGYNKLTSLDVSKNIALIYLSCTRNDSLKTLNVSKNTALKILNCSNNGLSSLDVSNNTALTSLSCYSNNLTSLNVSKNTALNYLNCCGNPFTTTAYDSIMCSLPIRNSGNNARFYPLFGSSDANATKFAASNSLNAKAKNWNVLYFDNLEIPATSGNFDCSTLIPQVNMNRYITLKCTKDSLISINLSANNANTPIKIVSGTWDTTINADVVYTGNINYFAGANTMTIYGDVTKFNCAKNYSKVIGLDVSENTALTSLQCYTNQITSLDVTKNIALCTLRCDLNNLTSLNVSGCTSLVFLSCYNNNLTSLNVSGCTRLYELSCYNNSLTTLDVSHNTALNTLSCDNNNLTSLDVSHNTALRVLNCLNNSLTSLNISKCTALNYLNCCGNPFTTTAYDSIMCSLPSRNSGDDARFYPLENVNDTNSAIFLATNASNATAKNWQVVYWNNDKSISTSGNYDCVTGYPPQANMSCYITLNVAKDTLIKINLSADNANTPIKIVSGTWDTTIIAGTSLTGNIYYPSYDTIMTIYGDVKEFDCSNNDSNITGLDVSHNTALTYLRCGDNKLTSLDVSKNTALTHLECGDNKLTSLDVSACTALTHLECYGNKFTTAGYDSLMCSLPSRNSGDNAKFYPLYNANDANSAIFLATNASNAIAKNWEVRYLYANQGSFPATSGNYDCVTGYPPQLNMNRYITLKVKQGEQINIALSADTNNTPIKIVSGAWDITIIANAWEYYNFYVAANTLTIYGNVSKFNCSNNDSNIIGLDASHNTSLTYLYCDNNNLTSLNISSCTALKYLSCDNNSLSILDVSGCTSLEYLSCYNNNLTTLDVSGCTSLEYLSCDNNSLTTLNVSSCTALKSLHCTNNRLSILDVSGCTSLGYLHCENNSLTTLDVSKCITLKELRCYENSFSTNGYDSLMCSLPINNSGNIVYFVPLNNSSDATASAFMASNATNATAKNWKVIYYSGGGDIPATSGTYTCSGGGTNPEDTTLIVNTSRYITLNVKQGEQIRFALCADTNNTPIKIASGAWDTTIMADRSSAYYIKYPSYDTIMAIYGNVISFESVINANIIGLDASHNTILQNLNCSNNNLTSLDVTGCTSLYGLNCSNNNLDTLDVSGCTALTNLDCSNNNLTSLDVSSCTALTNLDCSNNNLTTLDVITCTSLGNLTCHNNQLTSLNINDCSLLYALSCYGNKFSTNGYDSLMCLFTDYSETGTDNIFYPLYDANDTNSATFLAANATNATAKNWQVLYYDNYNPITTNGTYTCTFGGERLIDTTNYITLIGKQGSLIDVYCNANSGRTFVKIVSGQWDTVALCDNIPELYFYDSIITIYGAISNFNIYIDTSIIAIDASNHTSLEYLYFSNTRAINSLNVSGCTNLAYLDCNHNRSLTSLDVTGCTALVELSCINNNLTSLDVSTCTNLKLLDCDSNNLTSLNVSACTALNYLKCHSNSFTTATYDSIMCSLPIRNSRDKAKFFPLYVANNNDNYIFMASNSNNAIAKNWNILYAYAYQETIPATSGTYNCSGDGTTPEDTTLIVNTSRYITLNVKQGEQINIALSADTNNTPIKIVSGAWDTTIIANAWEYYNFYVAANTLTIYGNVSKFKCSNNDSNIIGLDASHNTSLTYLYCDDNSLTSLNVSGCTSLEELFCGYNNLTTLNISSCTALKSLHCTNNSLSILDVSGCTSLEELHCYNNNLTTLNVSSCTALTHLSCDINNLSTLNVSSCRALKSLHCTNNRLSILDVSGCTSLGYLHCENNSLTTLDVSKCITLKELRCYENSFSTNGYDSLMCSLPINNSGNIAYFVPLNNSSDATASAFMASNATNATAKNWKVIYYSGGGDIPATSGTYTCSGGGGTTPQVNMNRYITLNVKQGEQITINLTTDSANIPVRVVSGDSISDFTTKTATWMRDTKFYATSNTMVIYGDVKYFSCKNNTINIVGIDISNNTQLSSLDCSNNNLTRLDISKNTSLTLLYCNNNNLTLLDASKNTSLTTLSCFNNKFTTAGYDSLMCLLPTLGKTGEFIPLESDTSANVTIFMASNSNNAKDKKWNVFYVDYTNIPATTGTYTCSNIPDDPTSISEVSLSNIELYPNPAKTMLTIENATENVQIFDVAGRKIMQVENKGEALLQINIANLAKGMYFVKVGNYTTKFVKE